MVYIPMCIHADTHVAHVHLTKATCAYIHIYRPVCVCAYMNLYIVIHIHKSAKNAARNAWCPQEVSLFAELNAISMMLHVLLFPLHNSHASNLYVCMHACTYVCMYACTCMRMYVYAYMHCYMYCCLPHTHTHAYTCAYIRTHAHVHTYTRMHMCIHTYNS